jgi:toxin ParE1/3/4
MRLRVTRTARRDLDAIFDYWARRVSPDTAGRLIYSISDVFPLIAEFPEIGRTRDEIMPGIRSFPSGQYLIYYRKGRGVVHILQIPHGARNQPYAFTQAGRGEDP